MNRAVCAAYPPAWWFPDETTDESALERVREICVTCPVRRECLDFAVTEDRHGVVGTHGIYAGLTESQRSSLRRGTCVGCRRNEDPAVLWARVGNWRPTGLCMACDALRAARLADNRRRYREAHPLAPPPPPEVGAGAAWWPDRRAVNQ